MARMGNHSVATAVKAGVAGAMVRAAMVISAMSISAMTVSAISAQPAPAAQPPTTAEQSPLRAGMLVRPDTVYVGDLFSLVITVEVPKGSTVQWPVITDTNAVVAMRAPTRVTTDERGAVVQETAEYTLSAWNVGTLPIGLTDVTVREASGVRTVSLRDARIVVATVLPGDTSLHVPKPARALFPRHVPWWELWWPAAAVVAALGLLWWLWRRRKSRIVARPAAPVDVYDRAVEDFARMQRLGLVESGECSRAVALSVEILRAYLSARIPAADVSCTSHELVDALRDDVRVPLARTEALLLESDVIKFGRHSVERARAIALHEEARAIVDLVERADKARRQAELQAREAARQQEQDAKVRDEDDARRRSRRPKAGAK